VVIYPLPRPSQPARNIIGAEEWGIFAETFNNAVSDALNEVCVRVNRARE
jgi:hypothetical protein